MYLRCHRAKALDGGAGGQNLKRLRCSGLYNRRGGNGFRLSLIHISRLSHDLIGNIGAVANAVELLNEGDEDDREDIGNILNFSSKVLSRRLKFFRLCFGMSNAAVKTTEELATVMQDYLLRCV